ncbi:MAG: hypothetical protein ACO3A2_09920 [Bdellovibrionia bacterium]
MDSDEANLVRSLGNSVSLHRLFSKEEYFDRWTEHPASSILHHDHACCETARFWFLAQARCFEMGSLAQYQIKAPTWLSQLFRWGPSPWPISWCELVKRKTVDCGVFAALAREVFRAQGHDVHPGQALISYNETSTRHWKNLWKKNLGKKNSSSSNSKDSPREPEELNDSFFPWIGNRVVYHEICALERPEAQAKLYDSTWGTWYEPERRIGYGALLAVRVESPRLLHWGNHTLSFGEWMEL